RCALRMRRICFQSLNFHCTRRGLHCEDRIGLLSHTPATMRTPSAQWASARVPLGQMHSRLIVEAGYNLYRTGKNRRQSLGKPGQTEVSFFSDSIATCISAF